MNVFSEVSVGIRDEAREATRERVLVAAAGLFASSGYAATTIGQIAEAAGVSVGSVAAVGSKDALFLQIWEERSTAQSLAILEHARGASESVTERVWSYFEPLVQASIEMPEQIRDYFVAYLRTADHEANQRRVDQVVTAIRGLFPDDGLPAHESPTMLAALTLWLSFSALCFSLAASSIAPESAMQLMRRIVCEQCAPFEAGVRT